METVLLIIYAAASYWATNKVLYEGKVVFYSSAYVHYMKKFLIGMMFAMIRRQTPFISMIIGMGFMENSKKWCAVSCRKNRNNKNSDTPGYSSGSLNPLRFKLLYLKL